MGQRARTYPKTPSRNRHIDHDSKRRSVAYLADAQMQQKHLEHSCIASPDFSPMHPMMILSRLMEQRYNCFSALSFFFVHCKLTSFLCRSEATNTVFFMAKYWLITSSLI